jgi:hypothetical protein
MEIPPVVFILVRIVFVILSFAFLDEFENCSFHVFEELCWDFDGNCIGSVNSLWWDVIFTILILPIHEHGRLTGGILN